MRSKISYQHLTVGYTKAYGRICSDSMFSLETDTQPTVYLAKVI